MLKSCIQLSAWPRTTNTVNSVPANHVACVVVAATIKPRTGDVHVTGHPRLGMNEYLSLLERYGFKVPEGSYDAGRTNSRQDQEQHALMLLCHFCINYLPATMRAPELDGRDAVEILKADTEMDRNRREPWLWHQQGRCGQVTNVFGRDQVREPASRYRKGPVGPVTEGGPSRALEGLEGEGGGSARLVALEGDDRVGGCGVY